MKLLEVFCIRISKLCFFLVITEDIKQATISPPSLFLDKTKQGLTLDDDKSVKGKGIKIIEPFLTFCSNIFYAVNIWFLF